MTEVVKELLTTTGSASEHGAWVINSIRDRFLQEALDELKQRLVRTEELSLKSTNPIEVLRTAIMDAVDASALNSQLLESGEEERTALRAKGETFSEGNLLGVYLDAEFEVMCLRLYSFARYGDGGSQDWFIVYVPGAREYAKHMARVILADAGKYDGDPKLLGLMHQPFQDGHAALRRNLLGTPVGATFPE